MKKFFQFCAVASVALVFACGNASSNATSADSTATKADSVAACCASDSCATACTDSTACADSTCAKK